MRHAGLAVELDHLDGEPLVYMGCDETDVFAQQAIFRHIVTGELVVVTEYLASHISYDDGETYCIELFYHDGSDTPPPTEKHMGFPYTDCPTCVGECKL